MCPSQAAAFEAMQMSMLSAGTELSRSPNEGENSLVLGNDLTVGFSHPPFPRLVHGPLSLVMHLLCWSQTDTVGSPKVQKLHCLNSVLISL